MHHTALLATLHVNVVLHHATHALESSSEGAHRTVRLASRFCDRTTNGSTSHGENRALARVDLLCWFLGCHSDQLVFHTAITLETLFVILRLSLVLNKTSLLTFLFFNLPLSLVVPVQEQLRVWLFHRDSGVQRCLVEQQFIFVLLPSLVSVWSLQVQ